jgi:hypothetical protein
MEIGSQGIQQGSILHLLGSPENLNNSLNISERNRTISSNANSPHRLPVAEEINDENQREIIANWFRTMSSRM